MPRRDSIFYLPQHPTKPLDPQHVWKTQRAVWLAKAKNPGRREPILVLLDELAAYADGAKSAMLPLVQEGFGLSEKAAVELIAAWEEVRSGK